MSDSENMLKYNNYRVQNSRLKKAIDQHFYLEALFIEAAIIEDRCESLLRHSNAFNPEKHTSLDKMLARLKEMQRNKKGLLGKYVPVELLDDIYAWKKERNRLVHALMKQELSSEELLSLVEEGHIIAKAISSKSTSYTRALNKEKPIEK